MISTLEPIEELIKSGKNEEARSALGAEQETPDNRLDRQFLEGRLKESEYDREGALEAYAKVLDENPDHPEAQFRAAILCDQGGDDESALRIYEDISAQDEVPINILINLALLYEERGEFNKAERCLQSVLNEYPDNQRATQFLKSVMSSYTMVYDEKRMRDNENRSVVMDQPLTDFELSVRARNCLRQMNLRTLGDLLRTSEAELLAYKNFGETSLNEIKVVLAQKNLRLGQAVHSPDSLAPEPIPAAVPTQDIASQWNMPVTDLELSVRSRKCLQMLGVKTIGELITHSEPELLATQNFGQTSLDEIKERLLKLGVSFRT